MANILRKNTSFQTKITEFLKNIKPESSYSFLKYYQTLVKDYVLNVNSGARGILIDHSMGLGKTITAISIAMELYDEYPVIVLLTKALKQNFRDNIIKYVRMRYEKDKQFILGSLSDADLNNWILKNFSFVHVNAGNMIYQLMVASEGFASQEYEKYLNKKIKKLIKMGSLDNRLLIVDEAHNLFRAIINGSSNAIKLYDMIMIAKNLKLIFLSGTPITTDPFQLVPCFNMLGVDENIGLPLLPELYNDFQKYYINDGHMINKNKFQNRINGLVSFVNIKSISNYTESKNTESKNTESKNTESKNTESKNTENMSAIPTKLPDIVLKLPMTPEQYSAYIIARELEKDENKKGVIGKTEFRNSSALIMPKGDKSSSYRVRSRHISNYCPPAEFRDMKFSEINIQDIPKEYIKSPKLEAVLQITEKHPNRSGILYSQFIGIGGLGIIAHYLTLHKWKNITDIINSQKIGGSGGSELLGVSGGLSFPNLCGCTNTNPNFSVETITKNSLFESGKNKNTKTLVDVILLIYQRKIEGQYMYLTFSEATNLDIHLLKKLDEEKGINKNKNYNLCIEFPFKVVKLVKDNKICAYATLKYKDQKITMHNISVAKNSAENMNCYQMALFSILYDFFKQYQKIIFEVKLKNTCPYYKSDLELYNDFKPHEIINKNNKTKLQFKFKSTYTYNDDKIKKCLNAIKKQGGYIGSAKNNNNKDADDADADADAADAADDSDATDDIIEEEIKRPAIQKPILNEMITKLKTKDKKFAIISGETSEEQLALICDIYNSDENMHGDLINLLLISASGAEGLDLKNGGFAIIFEPYWNYSRISQFISRIVRINSHIALPEKEQTVQPYILLSVAPAHEEPVDLSTDVELYTTSVSQNALNMEFLDAIREVSIECVINNGPTKACRLCAPSDRNLFTWEPENDLISADPCEKLEETKISAKEIVINDVKYYYTPSDRVYKYTIYKYDSEMAAYNELTEDSEEFNTIIQLLEKNKKIE